MVIIRFAGYVSTYHIGLFHALAHVPRQPSGSGFGGGIMDEGVGATERMITHYIYQISIYTNSPPLSLSYLVECLRWPLAMEEALWMKG